MIWWLVWLFHASEAVCRNRNRNKYFPHLGPPRTSAGSVDFQLFVFVVLVIQKISTKRSPAFFPITHPWDDCVFTYIDSHKHQQKSCREIYRKPVPWMVWGFTIPWDASMMGTFVVLNPPGGAKSFRPGLPPLGFVDPCAGTLVACFGGHPPLGANGYWEECEAIDIGIEKKYLHSGNLR